MNTNLLKAHMALRGDTLNMLAEALGITRQALHNKMRGRSQFKQREIRVICERYNLKPDDMITLFFGGAA